VVHEEKIADGQPARAMAAEASTTTVATYEKIAQIYYEKWHDRSAVQDHLKRFAGMMRAYRLARLPVADVGCGPGFDGHSLRQAGLNAVGLDLSLAMMRAGQPEFGGPFIQADMRSLPLAPKIGGLWVSASLLHIPRAEVPAILSAFANILVPGGLLYLSLKAGQGSEWTTDSHGQPLPRYFVYWQPAELDSALQQAGFHVVDGWTSPASESMSWLIRFARKASAVQTLALNLD